MRITLLFSALIASTGNSYRTVREGEAVCFKKVNLINPGNECCKFEV